MPFIPFITLQSPIMKVAALAAKRQRYPKVSPATVFFTCHLIKHCLLAYLLHVYTIPGPYHNPLCDPLSLFSPLSPSLFPSFCKKTTTHGLNFFLLSHHTHAHTSVSSVPIPMIFKHILVLRNNP